MIQNLPWLACLEPRRQKDIRNNRHEPYRRLLDAMRELNTRIHPLLRQFDAAKWTDRAPRGS